MKKFLTLISFQIIMTLLFAPLVLKACDSEYDYQSAKENQWKYERENGLPYTSFSE